MPAEPIAVTGATGEVGGRVARRLAERGVAQRLVVRDAFRAPDLPGAEVREVPGGYADGEGLGAALEGVRELFLVPAGEAPDRVAQHLTAVDAAVAAGVERIVYLSFLGAAPDATFTLVRHHWATEERIRASGVRWTFVRMSLYMDFLPAMFQEGVLRGPAGDGRVAAVLRDDVADAVVAVLTTDGHDGQTYTVTGPAAFSLPEAAALLGARFEDETVEEAYASRAHLGPAWEVEGWVTSYVAVREGDLDVVTGDVRRLTGRDPVALEDYVAR